MLKGLWNTPGGVGEAGAGGDYGRLGLHLSIRAQLGPPDPTLSPTTQEHLWISK